MISIAGPAVPDWMLRDADAVSAAASRLREGGSDLRTAEGRLCGLLVDAATTLGWRGDAAQAAQARANRTGTQLDDAADCLQEAGQGLDRLGDGLAELGGRLRQLRAERSTLLTRSLIELLTGRTLPVLDRDHEPTFLRLLEIDRVIGDTVEDLAALDRATARRLVDVELSLDRLARLVAEDDWLATAAGASIVGLLGRYGVLESAADRELLAELDRLPDGLEGQPRLRALLGALPPEELADLLLRHPELARRLGGGLPTAPGPGTPEAALLASMGAHPNDPQARIAGFAAAFTAMPPRDRRRLALLFPDVVGRLDGAPLADRFAANRVAIGAALLKEQAVSLLLARAVRDRWTSRAALDELLDRAGLVVEIDDAAAARQRSERRVAYYQRLLHEELATAALAPGRPPRVGHQVLFFDATGDGRIAELWGAVDAHTRHVALFVPGTGGDMESFGGYSNIARQLAVDDTSGQTTTVAWMALDLPDDFGAATDPSYSQSGGPALRDAVWGLGVPTHVDTTAIGHSYGGAVVGVADREGLPVDRVAHVASAGAGRDVQTLADYAPGRDVDRFTLQAPGDFITSTQGVQVGGVGHGADVNAMDGVVRLETGRFEAPDERAGEAVVGLSSHSDVLDPDTTSWRNIQQVVVGGEVVPRAPRQLVVDPVRVPLPNGQTVVWNRVEERTPYLDPDYAGPDPVPVDTW